MAITHKLAIVLTLIMASLVPYSGNVWRGKFGKLTLFKHWQKKVYRSANRLLIVSIYLDGFSLANHGQFTKFAKLSPRQTFLLYGINTWSLLVAGDMEHYNKN